MILKGFDILLIVFVVFAMMFWCPFNMIEESFNINASHDLFYHANPFNLSEFSHKEFFGVVPRTFLGSVTLNFLARIWEYAAAASTASKFGISWSPATTTSTAMLIKWRRHLLIRAILACLNLGGYLQIRSAIRRCFGSLTARIFTLALSFNFHLIFYASRLLPNSLAQPLCSFALANFIEWQFNPTKSKSHQQPLNCFAYLFIGTFVFRFEFAFLLIPLICFFGWKSPLLSSSDSVPSLVSVIFSQQLLHGVLIFLLSIVLDSFLWYDSVYSHETQSWLQSLVGRQFPPWLQLMWAEPFVFNFNIVQDNMKRWGVSPFYWYFASAVPRSVGLFLIGLIGILKDRGDGRRKALILATLFWTTPAIAMSCFSHKELRFIFPSLVGLTAFAAIGFSRLVLVDSKMQSPKRSQFSYSAAKKSTFKTRAWKVLLFFVCLGATLMSMVFFLASVYRYPGGWALKHFNDEGVVRRCPKVTPGKPGAFSWSPLEKSQRVNKNSPEVHPTVSLLNHQFNGITTVAIPALLPNFITTVPNPWNKNLTLWNTNNDRQRLRRGDNKSLNTCWIHVGNYAAQTGVSRFLEFRGIDVEDDRIWCDIDKSPDHLLNPSNFDFLISDIPIPPPGFVLLYSILQFKRYSLDDQWKGIPLPKLEVVPTVFVYAANPRC